MSGTPVARKLTPSDVEAEWFQIRPGELISEFFLDDAEITQVRLPDGNASKRSTILNNQLLNFCLNVSQRPDVVQFISSLPFSTHSCLKRLKALQVPTVFAFTLPGKLPSNPFKRIIRKLAMRRLYDRLTCIVTASNATKNVLLAIGVKSRIEVIPNGVNLSRFRPAASKEEIHRLRSELGISHDSQVILSIGAIHPRKGIDILLEAWIGLASRFPKLHLFLIGMRHDLNASELVIFRNHIQSLISASNAPDRVHFLGYVENVDEYLRASDLFVFPSRREGMPNAVLEAMATNLPCLLSPFIGLSSDFGKPGNEYILVDHNPTALADMATRLMTDPAWRERIGANGRRWVQATMNMDDILDRYADMYRGIAQKSNKN